MSRSKVIWRDSATEDLRQAALYYEREGGLLLARRFLHAAESTARRAADNPRAGATRYGALLGITGLRTWRVQRFPYLVFYVENATQIEIRRVLHTRRDLLAELDEDD